MINLCKSYALNISAVIGFLYIAVFGKSMLDTAIPFTTGTGGVFGFIFIPVGLAMSLGTLLGLIWEYLAKEFQYKFAYNFPCEKIPLKPFYYVFFYLGLIGMVSPILLSLIIFK